MLLTKNKSKGCEDVRVENIFNKYTLLIVDLVNRHPTYDVIHFKSAVVSLLKNFIASQNYAVLGDININYDKIQHSSAIANYVNHINSGFAQLIAKLTRITANFSSVIDHFRHIRLSQLESPKP